MNAWARAGDGDPACTAWRPWGEVLGDDQGKAVQWLLEYGVYIALAVRKQYNSLKYPLNDCLSAGLLRNLCIHPHYIPVR